MFFCEFCEIFKNTFFNRTTPVAVSENMKYGFDWGRKINLMQFRSL